MMVIFFFASLLVFVLIALGVKMSLALHTRRVFKRRPSIRKRPTMRGAMFASPYLHDALFEKNEKHHHFWSTEVEYDEAYYL